MTLIDINYSVTVLSVNEVNIICTTERSKWWYDCFSFSLAVLSLYQLTAGMWQRAEYSDTEMAYMPGHWNIWRRELLCESCWEDRLYVLILLMYHFYEQNCQKYFRHRTTINGLYLKCFLLLVNMCNNHLTRLQVFVNIACIIWLQVRLCQLE